MAEKKIIEIGADVGDALKEIKNLFSTMVEEEKKAQKQTEATIEAVKEIGLASKQTLKGVESISKGFKVLGVALKAAGIGLLISAMTSVKEIFSQNQRVVDAFAVGFETFSGVINQVVTALFNVYDIVSKSKDNFNGLTKVLSGLLTLAVTPLKVGFLLIKKSIQQAQLAWEKSFFGDKDQNTIKELNKDIAETAKQLDKTAVDALNAGKDIYNNIGDAIGEVKNIGKIASEELSKVSLTAAYETAKTNVSLKNTAQLAAAQQARLVEQYDRQAEQLRQIRDDERNSLEVRKKANEDLNAVLHKQEKAMLGTANAQIAAAQAEVSKSNTIENQVALIDALANKEGVLAQIEGLRSEQKANDLALDKESIELTNSKLESESKLSIERKRFNAEQIEDKLASLQKLKEIDELEAEQESLRLQNIVNNAQAGTQAKIDAEIALNEFLEQSRQQNITREKEIADEKNAIELKTIEDTKKAEAERIAAKTAAVDAIEILANAETGIGKALLIAKQALALQESLMDIKRITFKGTQAIGEAGVATSQNVAESSKIGFPQNIVTIAGAIAQGVSIISSVKKAVSKTRANASSISASVPSVASVGGGASTQAQAPSFNIVGQSSTNQLASAINGQNERPIKTYVTSNDVSTAQAMDRNIVEGASI